MAGQNRINFQVGFNIDKAGLSEMQSLFQNIVFKAAEPGNKLNAGLQQAAKTANTLDTILSKTFNTELGSLNVVKFNKELEKSGLTLKTIQSDFNKIGSQGADAYNRLAQAVLGTNQQLRQSSKILDKMFTSIKNVFQYNISATLFNSLTGAIEEAYTYSKKLDTSLNDIRIVTDKSADNMAKFAKEANEASKAMGASTLDYTNASLIYYQQGLSDAEVKARTETTIKAANVTGQTGEEVSEQLTAVWNGYKVTAAETELYVDKLAAVAATTAADLEELSTGMSKVASAANAMGVDFDDLNAQIATIVSVTRQAPESVGTALKTIYARLGDLKVDGVDEFGVSLGQVSQQLTQMGIQILDQQGNLRDMSSVIADVAKQWTTWTEAQKQAAAIAMAGKRQYNNLIALFENWDMYTDALNTSTDAMGTLQHQQDIYMESTAAKLKTLKAAWQGLYDDAINQDEVNAGIEALTNLVEVFDNLIDSFGGGIKAVAGFGAIISSVFNKQIANSINSAIQRMNVFKNNLELAKVTNDVRMQGASPEGKAAIQANTDVQIEYSKRIYEARLGLNQEQTNTLIGYQKEIGALEEKAVLLDNELNKMSQRSQIEGENVEKIKQGIEAVELYSKDYEEVLNRNQNLIPVLNDQLSILNLSKTMVEDITGSAIDTYDVIINEDKILNNLTKKEQELLSDLREENYVSVDIENSKKDLEKIIKRIISLTKQEEQNVEKEYNKAFQLEQKYKEIQKVKEQQGNIKQQADDMLELANSATSVTQRVTTVTSALGNMAMAWSSINSLIDTWNNKEIDFGDKILQTFITLGMTIPMLINSFTQLSAVTAISNAMTQTNLNLQAKEALLNITTAGGRRTKTQNIINETAAQLANNKVVEKELVLSTLENVAKQQHVNLSEEELTTAYLNTKAKLAESGANVVETGTTNLLTTAKTRLLVVSKKLLATIKANPWLVVLTAIAAGLAIAKKAYDNYIESIKEEDKKTLESVEAKEKEIKANEELYNSYIKLYNQLDKSDTAQADLRETALKLAEAYDIQGGSVLALNGYYDELLDKIDEVRKKELDTQINEAEKGAKAAGREAVIAASEKSKGYKVGSTYTFRLGANTEASQAAVGAAGLSLTSLGEGVYDFVKDLDYTNPKAVKEWMNQVDKMIEYYDHNVDEATRKSDSFYKALTEEQTELAENGKVLTEQLSLEYSGMIEKAILVQKQGENGIKLNQETGVEDLIKLKNKLQEEFVEQGLIPQEDFNEIINNYFKQVDAISDAFNKLEIAEQLNDKINQGSEEGLKDIVNKIKDFNSSELAYLVLHLDEAALSNDLQDWIDEHSNIISLQKTRSSESSFREILSNYDADNGITDTQKQTIYSSEEMSSYMPGEGAFNAMDTADQLNAVTFAWIENTKAVLEHRDAAKDDLEITKQDLEIKLSQANKDLDYARDKVKVIDDSAEASKELYEIGLKLAQLPEGESLSLEDQEKLIKIKKQRKITDDELIKNYALAKEKVKDISNEINDYAKQIEELDSLTENHSENIEKLNQVLDAQNKAVDSIQSNYKSLIDIIDSYNEAQAFTVDNVQELLTMDNRYVASLELENGQLSLNEETFKNLTLAKLDDMKVNVVRTAQEELAALAQDKVTDSANRETSAILNAAAAARDATEAAKQGALAWDEYAESMREAAGVAGSEYDAKAKEITDALRIRLLAIENTKGQISAGGASMRTAMGASSKSSSSKDKSKDLQEDEFDRYWELKKAIDAVDHSISKLRTDEENLHGRELIKALKEENKLLENQAQLYRKLADEQEKEAIELRGKLSAMGLTFDESGMITNYAAATSQALAEYNAAITQYNAGAINDDSLSIYEKAYDDFKTALERYDTLFYSEMVETQDKIDELLRKERENVLKSWEIDIQFRLDTKQLKRDWNDFFKEIEDDFKSVYKDLRVGLKTSLADASTYVGDAGTITTILNAVKDVNREIDVLMGGGKSTAYESVSQAQEKLKELNTQLMDSAKNLRDLWKEAWQTFLDGIDQVGDKFEDLKKQFENINDELDFQRQLIGLIYGDEAYSLMGKYYEGQQRANSNMIESTRIQRDMWKQLFEESGATLENQANWTEEQSKYYEKMVDAQKELNDLTIKQIELLQNEYKNAVDGIILDLEKALNGGRRLEDVKTQWERITADSDKYYDNVEGLYHIQTLMNKYSQSIADTADLKAQQKLNDLRERELKYLREKENLTEYDIKAANLRYELALKQIALEESQNNKTSMKLTRNEQGNWAYQYVADEEDVMSKRQELLDTWNELYQLANQAYQKNLDSIQSLNETYLNKLAEIEELALTNKELADERRAELDEWYFEQYALLAEENALYRDDLMTASSGLLQELYQQDVEAFGNRVETERELAEELVSKSMDEYWQLKDAIQADYDDIGSKANEIMTETRADWTSTAQSIIEQWDKSGDSVKNIVLNAYKELGNANSKYQTAVDELQRQVNRDFGETGISGSIDKATRATENLTTATEELRNWSEQYLYEIRTWVNNIEDAWVSVKNSISDAIREIEIYLQKVGEVGQAQQRNADIGNYTSSLNTITGNGGSGGGGVTSQITGYQVVATDNDGSNNFIHTYDNLQSAISAGQAYDEHTISEIWSDGTRKVTRYATGGYTGEWDDSEKLAFLHQKELVLNEDDTSNFLAGINTIRDLANMNGSIEKSIMQAVLNTASQLGNMKSGTVISGGNVTSSNDTSNVFNITAEFPNANNVEEIREAILSLPNIASQFVNTNMK